jgi:hypothetical protein
LPVDLTLHGRLVGTVFDLLGNKENDITYSVGWGWQSDELARAFIEDVLPDAVEPSIDIVQLQEASPAPDFTDIEIKANESDIHLLVEAKRGYNLPGLKPRAGLRPRICPRRLSRPCRRSADSSS